MDGDIVEKIIVKNSNDFKILSFMIIHPFYFFIILILDKLKKIYVKHGEKDKLLIKTLN